MSYYGPPYGVAARRNGTCDEETEQNCGQRYYPWQVCCTKDSVCGPKGVCCPRDSDCSAPIYEDPHCANNVTWDLYDADGLFCCPSDTQGFVRTDLTLSNGTATGGVGCAYAEEYPSGPETTDLTPVSRGNETDSNSSSSIPTPSPTGAGVDESAQLPPSTLPSGSDSGSSTNTGAIAGGVVGGVVGAAFILGLVWFLVRRRRKASAEPFVGGNARSGGAAELPFKTQVELEDSVLRMELSAQQIPHELPGHMPNR